MTHPPVPPYQHYLGRITQDNKKPEIYWLHFIGSDTPYTIPVNMSTAKSTRDFLTWWIARHEESESFPPEQPNE